MSRKFLILALVLATTMQAAVSGPAAPSAPVMQPAREQAQAAHLAAELLGRYHYRALPLDDAMSEKIFDQYLKALDPEKLFFLQSDVDRMAADRTKLDDALVNEDLRAPFAIFNLYLQREVERLTYARGLLKTGFDFRKKEAYQYERENAPWAGSENEIRDLWRKRVKNDWLRLKLAGKDDKSIAATLDKRYDRSLKHVAQTKSEDVFQIFMNAYTMAVDPHTNYMGPRAAEDFDISMRLSLFGIGAMLAERNDYITVKELVPGGAAALSGQLKPGDRIIGVGQGKGGEITDIQGWRLDDAVELIRGAAGSLVRLDILPADAGPDGKHRVVPLVRKKISLQEQAAKKSVVAVKDGKLTRRIGVIELPSFYEDFAARQKGDPNYRSATRDVRRLLSELRDDKVDAVLIDLRNNGGGSLTEAIDLTGLFIDKGPVVQERDARGKISVDGDTDAGAAWSGPLGVLINRSSASASEIFAAAIQDYGRGLIIGEPSFGKGTVQNMVDLDEVVHNKKPEFGELKLTIAQFFRINGGTTQLRGVTPDIPFPVVSDTADIGESSFDNALPWTQIKGARYSPVADLKEMRAKLMALHVARVAKNPDYQDLVRDIADFQAQRKKNEISLNEAERRKERALREAQLALREARDGGAGKGGAAAIDKTTLAATERLLRDDGLRADERSLSKELAVEKAAKDAKDVLLDEAAHILSDEAGLIEAGARVATQGAPASAVAAGE